FVAAFPLDDFYCPPEVLAIEVARGQRGHCNLTHQATGYKADVYMAFDDLHRWGLAHRRTVELDGLPARRSTSATLPASLQPPRSIAPRSIAGLLRVVSPTLGPPRRTHGDTPGSVVGARVRDERDQLVTAADTELAEHRRE